MCSNICADLAKIDDALIVNLRIFSSNSNERRYAYNINLIITNKWPCLQCVYLDVADEPLYQSQYLSFVLEW